MRRNNTAFVALGVLGLVYAWRNRFRIQNFLEARGIKTPTLNNDDLSDTVRSGIAKVTGKVEHGVREADRDTRRAL